MPTAIRIENLSKQYRLGQVGTGTLSHDLNRWWAKIRGKEDPYSTVGQVNQRDKAAEGEYVWALKDINFEVEQGEVLGIIGANGAGKSTLLKLISRITSPTTGTIKAKGRIASLLEVGTGMHPEMTARENIYLNGSILGMRRHEITRKFDDIIDFAGCRMYVDTPVKRYSSGMRVRLGFAVAAFLEPEILIVDEVLAVGDAEFQKRALGKMEEVANQGRTIILVSHILTTVLNLATRCLRLDVGTICADGHPVDVIGRYLHSQGNENKFCPERCTSRKGDRSIEIDGFEISPKPPRTGSPCRFIFCLNNKHCKRIEHLTAAISVMSPHGHRLFQLYSQHVNASLNITSHFQKIVVEISSLPLLPGRYPLNLWIGKGNAPIDWLIECFTLSVQHGEMSTGTFAEDAGYPVVIPSTWTVV